MADTPEVLVYAGTSEGRELLEWLSARSGVETYASLATEQGAQALKTVSGIHLIVGRRTQEEKLALVAEHRFRCIVDATHPYATHISASLERLSSASGLDLIRIGRAPSTLTDGPWTRVASTEEAARAAQKMGGNILLTTGSHEIATFVRALPDAQERLYVRILPTPEALKETLAHRIPASHIICMQGPFSVELNQALIRDLSISCLVTKDSGARGGFAEKLAAVRATNISAIIIERPPQDRGISLDEAKEVLEVRYGL